MTTKRVWLWCVLLMVLLTGCGGGSKEGSPRAQGPADVGAHSSSPSAKTASVQAESTGGFEDSSVQASPPAPPASAPSGGEGRSASRPAPEPPRDRPGLGTEWGESRTSRVHDVTFTRADSDRPFAMAQLFYNDRRGVEAQASFHARGVERRRDFSAAGGAISVAIHDGSGDALEAVRAGDRTYVVGQSGERYTIVLTNHTGHRFEAVATVDGLDVINGKTGTLQNRGYVLMPFATLEIDGFRQSHDAVAAFRFAAVSD